MTDSLFFGMPRDNGKEDDGNASFRLETPGSPTVIRQPPTAFRRASGRILPAAKNWIQKRALSLRGLHHPRSPQHGLASPSQSESADEGAEEQVVMTEELWADLCAKLPSLQRTELQLSELVVVDGANAQSFPVTGIQLGAAKSSSSRDVLQQQLRQELCDSIAQEQQGELSYCLKIPHKKLARDPEGLQRAVAELMTETKLLSSLHHPNLPVLRGIGQLLPQEGKDPTNIFLLTDCVQATLSERIREWRRSNHGQPPDEDDTPMKVNYALQLARVLRYLHQHKILLCDLKPQSVGFAAHDPHLLVLMDLGRAKQIIVDDDAPLECQCTTLFGTRRYLAPEVLLHGKYSARSDVYSWATVVYEIMAERKPYEGLTAEEHEKYVCHRGRRESLNYYYFPEAMDQVISQAWHADLEQRWGLPKICDELQTFLMTIDPVFYNYQKPGDFLFDLVLEHSERQDEEDAISELGMGDHRRMDYSGQRPHLDYQDGHGHSSSGVDLSLGLFSSSSAMVLDEPFPESAAHVSVDLSELASSKLSCSNSNNHATTGSANVVPHKIASSAA